MRACFFISASKLKGVLAVRLDVHGEKAMREPVSLFAPDADILDQGQEVVSVSVETSQAPPPSPSPR